MANCVSFLPLLLQHLQHSIWIFAAGPFSENLHGGALVLPNTADDGAFMKIGGSPQKVVQIEKGCALVIKIGGPQLLVDSKTLRPTP